VFSGSLRCLFWYNTIFVFLVFVIGLCVGLWFLRFGLGVVFGLCNLGFWLVFRFFGILVVFGTCGILGVLWFLVSCGMFGVGII